MNPIKAYLKNKTFPKDKRQAKKIKKRSSLYYKENNRLYKRGFSIPLLMCLNEKESNYVLREFHEGICESYVAEMFLTLKALRNG